VGESHRVGATYAYWCVLGGVFVTALYTFRMIFLTFHGEERFRHPPATSQSDKTVGHEEEQAHDTHESHGHGHEPHESPWVVTLPLIALAIPSALIGFFTVGSVLFGDYFRDAIFVLERNNVVGELAREFHGPVAFALHGFVSPPFLLAAAGVATAWACFLWRPQLSRRASRLFGPLKTLLVNKFYFDWFNEKILAPFVRGLSTVLWRGADQGLIDGALVNGTAATVGWVGSVMRLVQNGYLYSYAFWMVIGLAVLLGWVLIRVV